MKKILFYSIILVLVSACSSVPHTGRKQLALVSDQEVLSLSLQQYSDYIKSAPISTDKTKTALVVKVGQNIANAVKLYYQASNMESMLDGYSWEFNLVKDDQANAFCMPGGKIVVYEGILPYTLDETGLAVVLGHEVAHAVAKHANERMSQQVVAEYGSAALEGLLTKSSGTTQTIGKTIYGLGAQYGVMLPFSRKQELEADYLGLIFMSIAGYDPNQAVPFWQRMAAKGSASPEFMSTHPSDENRINQIKEKLPEAMEYYDIVKGNTKTNTNATPSTSKQATPSKKTSDDWKF